MSSRRLAWFSPLAVVVTAGCFATRNDVRVLQADVSKLQQTVDATRAEAERARGEGVRRDSAAAEEQRRTMAIVNAQNDSLVAFLDRFSGFGATVKENDRTTKQLLYSLQELLGLSTRAMAEMRTGVDEARRGAAAAARGDSSARGGTSTPSQLYQLGLTQMRQSRYTTARVQFEELLSAYPNDTTWVPNAMYQVGETYRSEGNNDAIADSIYASVVERFPKSEAAPKALYRRAFALEKSQPKKARSLYEQLIRDYPETLDEHKRAKVRLRDMGPS